VKIYHQKNGEWILMRLEFAAQFDRVKNRLHGLLRNFNQSINQSINPIFLALIRSTI